MTGCLNQVAIRERRGLCSMAACVQVSLHVPNVALVAGVKKMLKSCHFCSNCCTRHMLEELVEVEGEELLYDSMLRYADVWMGGGGGAIRMSFFDSGGDEGEEDLHNDYG